MGKQNELALHVKGALNNGLTEVEIRFAPRFPKISKKILTSALNREALLQIMVYTGMPNGLQAFRTADTVIQEYKAAKSASS